MSAQPASESAAIELALGRFADMVRSVGWRHRFAEDEVDELLQEVRIRLWRARGEAENIAAAPASYVYRTAMSASLDLIRRRRARRDGSHDARALEFVPAISADASPEYALEEHELQHCLLRAVDRLGDGRRAVVRMYLAGHSRDQIAELLGWTEAKTRNLLYRGLTELRQRLADQGIGTGDER